ESTVQHAVRYFGNHGRSLFATLMIVSMLGWFGIQLNVMSMSLGQLLQMSGITIPLLVLNIVMGILLGSVMCLGMKAMEWLSYLSAPLLVITLLYAVGSVPGGIPLAAPFTNSWLG